MSSENKGSNFLKGLGFYVILPIFVAVIGGLAVEYLRPRQVFYGPAQTGTTSQNTVTPVVNTSPNNVQPAPTPPKNTFRDKMRKLLTRTWYARQNPQIHGDISVEFTENGQVIRNHYTVLVGNTSSNNWYKITEDGQLQSDPKVNLKLVKLTDNELILSWNGAVTHYKRGWYWWEIGLVVGGVALFILFVIVVSKANTGK